MLAPFRLGVIAAAIKKVTSTSPLLLLMHFDGTNGATTYTDSSEYGRTLSAGGTSQIITAQSKFGGSSLSVGATTNSSLTASIPELDGDFTVEGWFFPLYNGSNRALVVFSNGIGIYRRGDNSVLDFYFPSSTFTGTTAAAANTWHHLAICRQSGTIRVFLNGTLEITRAYSTTIPAGDIRFGGYTATQDQFAGHLDEFRVLKGVAIYTANFTPPTTPYPNP